jgi:hypothetical protein
MALLCQVLARALHLTDWKGTHMKKLLIAAGAAASLVTMAAPASAATVVYGAMNPGGVVTLLPAGPGAVAKAIEFDVTGTGDFTAVFSFLNPFSSASANGSASFNFDPDVLIFTGGSFSGGGVATIGGVPGVGSSIQIDRAGLTGGSQTLTITGRLNQAGVPTGGNGFARVGGSLTLTQSTAVPEPATWALFILGFGAVGSILRRRNGAIRVSKAKLNFA